MGGKQGQAILDQALQPEQLSWYTGRGFINDSFLNMQSGRYPMSVVPRDGDGGWKEQNWEGEDHSSHLRGNKR